MRGSDISNHDLQKSIEKICKIADIMDVYKYLESNYLNYFLSFSIIDFNFF